MNIYNIIQSALTALNSSAELFLLEKARAENRELEHTGDTVVIYPDWRITSQFTQALEITKTGVYNIDFKTLDEWDNSDNNDGKTYDDRTSVERIEEMEVLANSVMYYIASNNDLFDEIKEKPRWVTTRPILRENNGTMTGVRIQATFVFRGERECDYT